MDIVEKRFVFVVSHDFVEFPRAYFTEAEAQADATERAAEAARRGYRKEAHIEKVEAVYEEAG